MPCGAPRKPSGDFSSTQDLDFSDTRMFAPGTHHGILLVNASQAGERREPTGFARPRSHKARVMLCTTRFEGARLFSATKRGRPVIPTELVSVRIGHGSAKTSAVEG
jgi:hypothetical protein